MYFLDQISKICVRGGITQGSSIPIIKNVFHVTLVYNTGAAFGMFSSRPHLFVIVAVLFVFIINYFLLRKFRKLSVTERAALCCILAGTLGNLTDRLRFGHVIDFIDFRIWPVFNLADSLITIGAALLILTMLFGGRCAGRGGGHGSRRIQTKDRRPK